MSPKADASGGHAPSVATPADEVARAASAVAPSLKRRLAAFVYEGVLLFGVTMAAGLVYGSLTQQRHALQGKLGLQLFLFVVLGVYFSWFWSRSGQTVAMKAWHIRLVSTNGLPLSQVRAFARYVLSWLWFVPALATAQIAELKGSAPVAGMLLAGVLAYASLIWLRPDRQFWHDVVCGTRLIDWRPALPPRAKSSG